MFHYLTGAFYQFIYKNPSEGVWSLFTFSYFLRWPNKLKNDHIHQKYNFLKEVYINYIIKALEHL